MQIFLYKPDEVFTVSEFVRADYDGFTLRVYFHGELSSSHEASIGDCFFVTSNGSKKLPTVVKAELPNSRGAKIAWALSFVGENKYVENGNEFWNRCQKISDEITDSEIDDLVERFSQERSIFCPTQYLKVL